LAVESGQSMRDLMWAAEHHPDLIETVGAYVRWRNDQQRRRHGT
jgi:hypothetical protein